MEGRGSAGRHMGVFVVGYDLGNLLVKKLEVRGCFQTVLEACSGLLLGKLRTLSRWLHGDLANDLVWVFCSAP